MIARRQVADLNKHTKVFERKNIKLVVIGNGPVKYMASFREATRYKGLLFTDPSLKAHEILGLNKGVSSIVGWSPLKAGIRALRGGYLQKGIQGPPLQQGGVSVVGPGNHAHYLYRSEKAGDHPTVDEILEACKA